MSGIHDLGGVAGFGPVPHDPDEPPFKAPWQRRLFGIQRALMAQGIPRNLHEVRSEVESLPPHVYLATEDYERRLLTTEGRLVERGVLHPGELEQRRRELEADADRPLVSREDDELVRTTYERGTRGRPSDRAIDRPPQFGAGDAVRARNVHPRGHTRLVRYVRGRTGIVERVYPAFDLPDLAAVGESRPEYAYAVRFDAHELWGESAEPNTSVCVDLFESYLLPA
jgi:nitrile hydratase beta subunit